MPTYDYRCRDCDHEFEIHQSMSEDALTECPACGGDLRKVFSAVGISFKGSGFYKNDSSSGGSAGSGGSGGSTGSGDSSSGDSTSVSSSSDNSTSSPPSSSSEKATASSSASSSD